MSNWITNRERPEGTLVVYSAIFGDIPDRLRPPAGVGPDPRVRYVCFTDRPDQLGEPRPWETRAPVWTHSDSRRTARFHKILSHAIFPDTDYSLWLDGNIRLMVNPWGIVLRHLQNGCDIAAFRHRHRACIYEELEACIRLDKDDVEVMRGQVGRYRARGYPSRWGLAETGVLVRKHSASVRRFNQAWWSEIESGSFRDQLSFDYVLWSLGQGYAHLAGRPDRSPYVRYARHR